MKRLLVLAAPLLLAACMEKNPIDEKSSEVFGWYTMHLANLSEAPVSQRVMRECGNAVLADMKADPACEEVAAYFTPKLNASSLLNSEVEPQHWYSKNFWSKWIARDQQKQEEAPAVKALKNGPWGQKVQ